MAENLSTHEDDSRTWLEYRYRPLQHGHIRLIRLRHQGANDAHVECNIETYPVDKCPRYMALSYCWGKDIPRRVLVVNGRRQITLRDNLFGFLRRVMRHKELVPEDTTDSRRAYNLRQNHRPPAQTTAGNSRWRTNPTTPEVHLLWVDAICINQADNEEKNMQLTLMRTIYASASRIIVWLGEDVDDSDTAMEVWHRIAKQTRNEKQTRPAPEISERELLALACLQQREYWRRVWVLQEASTAGVPREIWCGDKYVDFDGAVVANEAIREYVVSLGQLPYVNPWIPELGNLATFEHLRSEKYDADGYAEQTSQGRNSFLDMIYKTRDLEATNPRDKIYALLPIYSDIYLRPLPQADYNEPVGKAFRDAAVHILVTEHDTRVFLLCSLNGPFATDNSWVPNFRTLPQYFPVFVCHDKFRASADTAPRLSYHPDQRAVTFRGTRFGTVREVHRPLATPSDQESSTSAVFWQGKFDVWAKSVAQFFFPDGADADYVRGGLLSEGVDRLLALDCCPGLMMERTGQVLHWLPLREIADGGEPPRLEDVRSVFTDLLLRVGYASLFWTTSGLVGIGDPSVRAGDLVVVCFGLSVPLVLRSGPGFDRLVGPCVVQGMMDGEALGRGRVEDFLIF